MTDLRKDLRDYMFRGLMFESEANQFQAAGIQVGADQGQAEERLLSEALSAFGVSRRNNSLEMARLYAVLHCFENEVRSLIRETLEEKEGADWIDKLPTKIKQHAESRQKTAFTDSWLEGEKSNKWGQTPYLRTAQTRRAKRNRPRPIKADQLKGQARMDGTRFS